MKIKNIHLTGSLGQALQYSVHARLKTLNWHLLAEPFLLRNETDNAWRCEFWGKIMRSAILSNYYVRDPGLAEIIENSVREILSAQTPDGCISSYPAEKQLGGWDIWGRKYILHGLVRYYELVKPDEAVKEACVRLLDHLIGQLGGHGANVKQYGQHGGLPACSICDAVMGVYRISGEVRFLDFARQIIESGASTRHDIFHQALAGTPPAGLGNGKAYEMTSCFQGLAELYRIEQKEEYREICLKYYEMVRDQEIFITGVGGGADFVGEYWCGGALEQTAPRPGSALGETCVTTTWLHYCDCIRRMTQDPSPAEEAERALYNGILGAMCQDGSRWLHKNPTPLTGGGVKVTPPDQIFLGFRQPYGGNDCCRAQGPEALALAPGFAVRSYKDGLAIDFFESADVEFEGGSLSIRGGYPYTPETEIRVKSEKPMPLYIRITPWLKSMEFNGRKLANPGPGYYYLTCGNSGEEDVLHLTFDFQIRKVAAPGGRPFHAYMRGPLVLAEDERGVIPSCVRTDYEGHLLCDYASAGKPMDEGYAFTVWFADPE